MTRSRARLCLGRPPWIAAAVALAGLSLACDAEDPSDANRRADAGGSDAAMASDAAYSCEAPSDEGGSPSSPRMQVASIHVTDSTNEPELDVAIYDDASAERSIGVGHRPGPPRKSYPAHSAEVEKFLCDLGAIPDLSAVGDHIERWDQTACGKSVSFGTMTTVTADGLTSGDVQCLVHPTPATSALAEDCDILTGRTYVGPHGCPREVGFFHPGTSVPMAALCDAGKCPATLSEALDAVHDDPTSAELNCGYELVTGCGVDSVASNLGTHRSVFHYSTETGALIGAEFDDDVEYEIGGCVDWTFISSQGMSSCTTSERLHLCGPQDDGGT